MPNSIRQSGSFAHRKVPQHLATNSPDVEGGPVDQLSLLGLESRAKPSAPVDRRYLFGLPTLRRAVAYSLSLADMDPKEAYGPLAMDKSTWSRIINGGQEVPAGLLKPLRTLTGNDAAQLWIAHDWGCELRPLRTELEEQLDAERAAHAETQRENALMRKLLLERK